MRLAQLWDDLKDIAGPKSNKFYRTATITWSRPEFWHPSEPTFHVPIGWAGHGGVYTFMHRRWAQNNNERKIVYVGKAVSFKQRLTKAHDHFDIIETPGETTVSCGRIAFEGIKHRSGYYEEIEDVIKFAIWKNLRNIQGFSSLPGFRKTASKVMIPWCIKNEGYRFYGVMPKCIIYPAIAVEY